MGVSVLLTLVSQLPQPSTQSPWLPQPLTQSLWLPQSMTELPQNQSRTPQRLPRPRPLTSPLLPPPRPGVRRRREADPAVLAGASRVLTAPTPLIHNPPVRPVVSYAGLPYAGYAGYAGYGYAAGLPYVL